MKLTNIIIAAMGIALAGCSHKAHNDAVESKIDALLGQMTLEEKLGQLNQVTSFGNVDDMAPMIKSGQVGSILNEADPARVNELQRIAVEESRLGIPLIMARDVIHGFKTVFPIPLGQAATFDPEVARLGARVAAEEATAAGIRWTFTPMIDIARDPRWGRIAESCGEDPYLTSVMGVAMVNGFQADSLSDPTALAACAKHYIGYGAAEGGADYNSSHITPLQMRNVYMPPFEAAAKAGAATFMTSFNDNDGIPSTGNRFLLRDVLRDEWGFDGFVVTDWNSAGEMLNHGFCADSMEVAEKALNAGVDMDMMSFAFINYLPRLLQEGRVKQADIDNAVRNVLRIKYRLGLFDHPYVDESRVATAYYTPEHLAAAKRAATESVILLKHDGKTLPLTQGVKRIAVVGPLADAPHDQMGTWAFDGEKEHSVTPLAALRKMGEERGFTVNYAKGMANSRDRSTAAIPQAVAAARNSDVVVAFLGEESILSGEGHSLACLDLQGCQSQLLAALHATGKPVVMVVMAGRPLTIARDLDNAEAVMYMFHPGTMGGEAIADLLVGDAVPSGKTPVTFPMMVGQVPIYYGHNNTGRPASGSETLLADIPDEAGQTSLGNTSYYLDAGFGPLFPFGYGLSYTTFAYGEPKIVQETLTPDDTLCVSVDITNTGECEGTEVAQLYVRDMAGSIARPVRELKRFERVDLKPGETKMVEFELPVSELAFYGIDGERKVEPGAFTLWVAGDSQSGSPVTFSVH